MKNRLNPFEILRILSFYTVYKNIEGWFCSITIVKKVDRKVRNESLYTVLHVYFDFRRDTTNVRSTRTDGGVSVVVVLKPFVGNWCLYSSVTIAFYNETHRNLLIYVWTAIVRSWIKKEDVIWKNFQKKDTMNDRKFLKIKNFVKGREINRPVLLSIAIV